MSAVITSTRVLATVSATLQNSRASGAGFASRLSEARSRADAPIGQAAVNAAGRNAGDPPAPGSAGANPRLRAEAVARAAQDIAGAAQRTSALLRALMGAPELKPPLPAAPSNPAPTAAVMPGPLLLPGLPLPGLRSKPGLPTGRDRILSDLLEPGLAQVAAATAPAPSPVSTTTASTATDSENLLVYLLMGRFCPPLPRNDPPRRKLLKRQDDRDKPENGEPEESAWDNDFCMQSILGGERKEDKPQGDPDESAA